MPRNATPASLVRELASMLRDPALLCWSLFVVFGPLYVFHSGLPQPGDLLIIPLVPLVLAGWNGRLGPAYLRPLRSLFRFTAWVLFIDWGWALVLGKFGVYGTDTFLLFPVYYVYNTLVFLIVCILAQRHGARFLWLTLHVVLAGVIFQVLASFVVRSGFGSRGTGFFNNPNQLGFFALLSASMLSLGRRRIKFGTVKTALGLTLCLYLGLLSASRAAVVGIGILFALLVFSNPKRLVVASLAMVGLVAIGGPVSDAIEGTQQRLAVNRTSLGFFEERGYDRILENKEYLVFGAGEGGTDRFAETTAIGASEIHSSAGTIFFSYGIVGVCLFAAFLFRVAQGAPLRSIILIAPTLSYTFAHQGLRATSAWIFFGVFVADKIAQRATAPSRPPAAVAPPLTSPGVSPA